LARDRFASLALTKRTSPFDRDPDEERFDVDLERAMRAMEFPRLPARG